MRSYIPGQGPTGSLAPYVPPHSLPACPKCKHGAGWSVTYRHRSDISCDCVEGPFIDEHLEMACNVCGYTFGMQVAS